MNLQTVPRKERIELAERLTRENQELRAAWERLTQRIAEREAELATRGPVPEHPPAGIKPNKPTRLATRKKKRAKRVRGFARKRRRTPDRGVEHRGATCPEGGCALVGGTIERPRAGIDLDLPPVVVTDHRRITRVCPQGACSCVPPLTEADGVVGQRRVGPNLLALIVTLHAEGRMPVEVIQQHRATLDRVKGSAGMIVDALALGANKGMAEGERIRDEIRASPVVHADETVGREDGINGDPWRIATPTARYFEAGRRTGAKIDAILGASFAGTLVTDVSAAADHFVGEKQRCWAHLLRDVKDLPAQAPADREVALWAQGIRRLYRAARDRPPRSDR